MALLLTDAQRCQTFLGADRGAASIVERLGGVRGEREHDNGDAGRLQQHGVRPDHEEGGYGADTAV